jgi:hypothetical protein
MTARTAAGTGRKSPIKGKGTPHAPRSLKRPPTGSKHGKTTGSKHGKTEDPRNEFSEDEWREMIATTAYYRAEARGFEGGSAEDDWYESEAELRERFSGANSDIETDSPSGGEATNIETTGE